MFADRKRKKSDNSREAIPYWLFAAFAAASFIGLADTVYLTTEHYLGAPVVCSLITGCNTVLASNYSVILGVPLSLLGVFYYLALLSLTGFAFVFAKDYLFRIAVIVVSVGFLSSLILIYIQIFVIKSICIYCMLSALTSTFLFILAVYAAKKLYFPPFGANFFGRQK